MNDVIEDAVNKVLKADVSEGAGVSMERRRRLKYNFLKKVERDLLRQGVQATYHDLEVSGDGFQVYFTGDSTASNGAWASWPVVIIHDGDKKSAYLDMYGSKAVGSYKTGLEEIVKRYKKPGIVPGDEFE